MVKLYGNIFRYLSVLVLTEKLRVFWNILNIFRVFWFFGYFCFVYPVRVSVFLIFSVRLFGLILVF